MDRVLWRKQATEAYNEICVMLWPEDSNSIDESIQSCVTVMRSNTEREGQLLQCNTFLPDQVLDAFCCLNLRLTTATYTTCAHWKLGL